MKAEQETNTPGPANGAVWVHTIDIFGNDVRWIVERPKPAITISFTPINNTISIMDFLKDDDDNWM